MAKYLLSLVLIFALVSTSFKIDGGDKAKVKFKKGMITVNAENWANYDFKLAENKLYMTTLSGDDFMSISYYSFGTGEYDQNGKEKTTNYQVLNFYNEEIGTFEVASTKKGIVRNMYNSNVLVEGKVNWENIKKFKTKYSDNISERRFLTK